MRDRLADSGFSGTVPVFPLPDVVFFPDAILPLHVFEPRYRAMVRDAAAGEKLIAVATLLPGWEKDYEGAPPFHPLATVGRIVELREREDGRFDLLLAGLERARLEEEFGDRPYRTARATTVPDEELHEDSELEETIRRLLLTWQYTILLRQVAPGPMAGDDQGVTLAAIVHTICQHAQAPTFQRLRALEAGGPAERVPMARGWLGEELDAVLAHRRLPRLKLERGEEN
jgi:Lon protease-like protein